MRFLRSRLRWLRLPVAMAMALGLVLQAAVPVQAAPVAPDWLAGSICHVDGSTPDTPAQPGAPHQHDHCVLCQLGHHVYLPPAPIPALIAPVVAAQPAVSTAAAFAVAAMRRPYTARAPPAFG
jgi:hypothetical protein